MVRAARAADRDGEDAIVRPIVASRCDGDTLPIHRHVSRAMQAGLRAGVIDPAVGHICGPVPFAAPFAIGHECVAEVVELGAAVTGVAVGDLVVVPWAVSCGTCEHCRRGLTAKCLTTRGDSRASAYGFGPASGQYGGMISDLVRVPYAGHMLVRLPDGLDPLRVAAASDNLADAWRTVVPRLRARPGARVLVVGGGARSIGLYAAGLAAAHGAAVVDHADDSACRRSIAQSLGATVTHRPRRSTAARPTYDIVVEASSSTAGLRQPSGRPHRPGSARRVGDDLARNTGVP